MSVSSGAPVKEKAKEVLMEIVEASAGMDGLFFVGLPLENRGKLYNVAAAYSDGRASGTGS